MTVAEIIAELQKLPGHLPVVGVAFTAVLDEEGAAVVVESYEAEVREVSSVEWQGRYVALNIDGPFMP